MKESLEHILSKDLLKNLYWTHLLTQRQISELLGCCKDTVKKYLHKYKLDIPEVSLARKIRDIYALSEKTIEDTVGILQPYRAVTKEQVRDIIIKYNISPRKQYYLDSDRFDRYDDRLKNFVFETVYLDELKNLYD